MLIKIGENKKSFENPTSLKEILRLMLSDASNEILGCALNGKVVELDDIISCDAELRPISFNDEEGRRIYERSLRFVFLIAVQRCFPNAHIRIEHSIGEGMYIVLKNHRLYPNDVLMLEETMRDIVKEDLPFTKHSWSKEQAIEYFERIGDGEKARLLSYRPYHYFNIYECGGVYEYFYGAMLPRTSYLKVFALHSRTPGLIMLMPKKANPSESASFVSSPKQMATFAQSNHWCRILECTDAADLNDRIKQGKLPSFIRINEALHDKSLAEIAEDIVNRGSRAIFIAGPSSSGKTTFANRLGIHLRANGLRPELISLDDFYIDRDKLPLEEDGMPDLEALDAIDVPLFKDCLHSLLQGRETIMPRFDFKSKARAKDGYMMKLSSQQPLIIEGIHGLNPRLHEGFDSDKLYKIYISELTCLNLDDHNRIRTTDARLLRRIVRDNQFRNTTPSQTLEMWAKVRRGEDKWIFPYQENADVIFNSALHYELPVLKKFAYELLKKVPVSDPNYISCNRLTKILNYLLPVDEASLKEIPPLSILREFIGGNTLYINED